MIAGFPKWIDHQEMPIWSIDAQPNGYRLLTGGGDNKIKIWNILPIIASKYELDNEDEDDETDSRPEKEHVEYVESLFTNEEFMYEKLLATLNVHTSPVNCVRWNKLGTLFASASDDGTIYIWEYRGTKKGAFQDSEKLQEDWMAVKSLRGHKDNIFEVKWAPDSIHLAS
jgi:WD40 repeat protein